MKKLMCAVAAATVCVAFAESTVQAPEVVGYINKGLKGAAAFNLSVNPFQTVGVAKDQMKLGDFGATDDWTGGNDEIKTLKANGAVDQAYTWLKPSDAKDWGCPAGWYLTKDYNDATILDLTPYCKNDTILKMGEGLVVLVGKSSTKLIYSGEVLREDQPIALKGAAAFNITGNISPTQITLGDIIGSNDWTGGNDELKTLKANGAVDQAYTYLKPSDAKDWGCPAGWYLTKDYNDGSIMDLTPYCKNATEVAEGEAFIVLVGKSSTTITIPSALSAAE